MKDKLLFGTIGLLVGIVVMQWTMPSGRATIAVEPVGVVVAAAGDYVLAIDGGIWVHTGGGWQRQAEIPVSLQEVQFLTVADLPEMEIVDKNGDQWERTGDTWVNRGQPPAGPIPTSPATFGKVKAQYQRREAKP